MTNVTPVATPDHIKRDSVWTPHSDFWTLGGLSILCFLIMQVVTSYRDDVPSFQNRLYQILPLFSILSIVCNHPHFMISYRFGYGRGSRFIFRNSFSLIAVPVLLLFFFGLAYWKYDTYIADSPLLEIPNRFFSDLNIGFRFGNTSLLGEEIVGLSLWLMYFTVGWHYCKQVYGCMMVYGFYEGYVLSYWQKQIFRWSVISVAIYQFMYITKTTETYLQGGSLKDPRFQGFSLSPLGLPDWTLNFAMIFTIILGFLGLLVIAFNFRKYKKWPPLNFLVAWVAFYVWWIPFRPMPEFMLMVPFFHSLQYLPFAMRLEKKNISKNSWYNFKVAIRILALLLVGFLSFEFIPNFLDKTFQNDRIQAVWFFSTVFSVFINIHHFFIDSVAWKFDNKQVKEALLYQDH